MPERPPEEHRAAVPHEQRDRQGLPWAEELAGTLMSISSRELNYDSRSVAEKLRRLSEELREATDKNGVLENPDPQVQKFVTELREEIDTLADRVRGAARRLYFSTTRIPGMSNDKLDEIEDRESGNLANERD